jgi:hypothetical protein
MAIKHSEQAKVYRVFPGSGVLNPMFRGKVVEIRDIRLVGRIPVGLVNDKKYGVYPVAKVKGKWIYGI